MLFRIHGPSIITLLVYYIIWFIVIDTFVAIIQRTTSVEKAIKARKALKCFRIVWPILGGIFYYLLIPIMWKSDSYVSDPFGNVIVGLVLFASIFIGKRDDLPISGEGKDSYLSKRNKFALYLRAFHNDRYAEEDEQGPSFFEHPAIDNAMAANSNNEIIFFIFQSLL